MSTEAPTYEEFIEIFPAFTSVAEASVEAALLTSELLLASSAWGDFYSLAVGLDAAHSLTIAAVNNQSVFGGLQSAVGPVSSVSAAGVSTSFGVPGGLAESYTDSWYNKTGYGQQFLRLRSSVMSHGAMAC